MYLFRSFVTFRDVSRSQNVGLPVDSWFWWRVASLVNRNIGLGEA